MKVNNRSNHGKDYLLEKARELVLTSHTWTIGEASYFKGFMEDANSNDEEVSTRAYEQLSRLMLRDDDPNTY